MQNLTHEAGSKRQSSHIAPAPGIVPAEVENAIAIMEQESIRRAPVLNATGTLVGIVSQVDVAMRASHRTAGKMLAKPRPLPLANMRA